MLNFYDGFAEIPKDVKVVKSNDSYFNAHTKIQDSDFCRTVLKEIDKAERVSDKSFKGRSDRFADLDRQFLSTGTKTLLNIVQNPNILVENMISLYKDKSVNKHNATLVFTTHYCEVLDQMGRQDNIWICKSGAQVSLSNMYEDYQIRPELLKSKQYYNNAFQTAVDYDALMSLKKDLKK